MYIVLCIARDEFLSKVLLEIQCIMLYLMNTLHLQLYIFYSLSSSVDLSLL